MTKHRKSSTYHRMVKCQKRLQRYTTNGIAFDEPQRLPRKLKKTLKTCYAELFDSKNKNYRSFLTMSQKIWFLQSIYNPLVHRKKIKWVIDIEATRAKHAGGLATDADDHNKTCTK